jgi:hypothetical protein
MIVQLDLIFEQVSLYILHLTFHQLLIVVMFQK